MLMSGQHTASVGICMYSTWLRLWPCEGFIMPGSILYEHREKRLEGQTNTWKIRPFSCQGRQLKHVITYIDIIWYFIWVNDNNSLTWNKAMLWMIPLYSTFTMIRVRENRLRSWSNLCNLPGFYDIFMIFLMIFYDISNDILSCFNRLDPLETAGSAGTVESPRPAQRGPARPSSSKGSSLQRGLRQHKRNDPHATTKWWNII